MRTRAVIILLLLVAAITFNIVMRIRAAADGRRRDYTLQRIDALMTICARSWGQPVDEVRAALEEVLRKFPNHRR